MDIDDAGNRVCAMNLGSKKVVILAGVNKIVLDVHEAVRRIHEVAFSLKRISRLFGEREW